MAERKCPQHLGDLRTPCPAVRAYLGGCMSPSSPQGLALAGLREKTRCRAVARGSLGKVGGARLALVPAAPRTQ